MALFLNQYTWDTIISPSLNNSNRAAAENWARKYGASAGITTVNSSTASVQGRAAPNRAAQSRAANMGLMMQEMAKATNDRSK